MTTALVIDQLSKTYANGFQALKGISLTVEQGDFFALLGPNGAGKSTTIGVLSSLVNKTAGCVSIFGHDLDRARPLAKQMIGIVPQEFNFNQFEKTEDIVITQAGYYGIDLATARQRSEQYLKQLGLWDKRHLQSRRLSGGMKRRLMIARALIHQPKLLILDEPTAGVDIELRRSMWAFLRRINRELGTTIILTTHYLEEAEQLCRNIAIIDQGQIIEHSSMKALLAKLQQETFILETDHSLSVAPKIEGFELTLRDEHSLEVTIEKRQGLNGLFTGLNDAGVEIKSMRNRSNRLEELFVQLLERHQQQEQK